jgi:hypothetical protein
MSKATAGKCKVKKPSSVKNCATGIVDPGWHLPVRSDRVGQILQ